jgi:tRNA modification GTPase
VSLKARLGAVQNRARQGALLREGIKVVIAGQPNAGKSSLLNALAGAELAIVSPVAGTTRDVISQTIQIHGVPLHVVDTAGLRKSVDEVEKIGIERAWGQIEDADAVLFLHDLTRISSPDHAAADAEIARDLTARLPAGVPVIDVWSKQDAVAPSVERAAGVTLSAKTGAGIEALRARLLETAGWQAFPEGVYLARARHVQALSRVEQHIDMATEHLAARVQALDLLAEELRLAQNALNEITGEFGADDLLGVIFSRFCIGK